jgi:hypothetical protein
LKLKGLLLLEELLFLIENEDFSHRENLLGNNRENFNIDTIELIKT